MFIIATTLWFLCAILLFYKLTYWKRKGVFQITSLSIFGIITDVLLQTKCLSDKVLEICQNNYDKPYFGVYTCLVPTLVLNDIDIIKDVSIKNIDSFLEHRIFTVGSKTDIYSRNLFACSGNVWKQSRQSLSPAFSVKKIREMSVLIQKCSTCALSYLKTKSFENDVCEVNVKGEIIKKYMADVIISTMFGVESNSFDNCTEFSRRCQGCTDISGPRLFACFGYCFPEVLVKFLKLGLFTMDDSEYFGNIALSIVQSRKDSNEVRPDVMHYLMLAQKGSLKNDDDDDNDDSDILSMNSEYTKKKSNYKITDEDIIAHALLLILAGIDTSTIAFDYLMYELAMNQDIQQNLVVEIEEVMEDDHELNANHLSKMSYLDAAVLESLRKWPPLSVTDRVCTEPFTINHEGKSLKLEKGSVLWVPIFAIHRNPKYWEDPEKFDPSRFFKENVGNINKNAFLPFGIGPKVCLGQRVAVNAIKMLVVNILRSYKIIPVNKTPDPSKLNKRFIFLVPEKPMTLGFQKR